MLETVLGGASNWAAPLESVLGGSSSWAQQELEIVLGGSSGWGTSLDSTLGGSSNWLRKTMADTHGTGGLYVRPESVISVSTYLRPMPKIIVKLGNTKISVIKGSIKMARSKPISWNVEIDSDAGDYGPTSDVADAARMKAATWSIVFMVGGEEYAFRQLVAEQYGVDAESGNIVINGTCLSHKLANASFMSDVDCKSSRSVIVEIASNYGVRVSCSHSEHIDYFHRALGNPIAWINSLTYPLADWSFENGILTVRPVEYGRGPRWGFTDREQLEVLSYQATPWAIRNMATVEKVVGGTGLLLDLERRATSFYEPGFFGVQPPATLPFPARDIRCRVVYAERGKLQEFVFDGAAGPASGTESVQGIYGGGVPITQVRFNYVPGADAFTSGWFIPGYRLRIFGQSAERAQCSGSGGGPWTGNKAVTGGLVQPFEDVFTVQHWTAEIGQTLANTYAYEGALRAESVGWRTQVSPWVRPGFNVRMTERRRTGYSNKIVFVQNVEHSWDHTMDEEFRVADSGTTTYDGSALLS